MITEPTVQPLCLRENINLHVQRATDMMAATGQFAWQIDSQTSQYCEDRGRSRHCVTAGMGKHPGGHVIEGCHIGNVGIGESLST